MQKRKVFYLIFQGQSSETKDIPVWYEAYFKSQNAARMQRIRSQSEFRDKERLQNANYTREKRKDLISETVNSLEIQKLKEQKEMIRY